MRRRFSSVHHAWAREDGVKSHLVKVPHRLSANIHLPGLEVGKDECASSSMSNARTLHEADELVVRTVLHQREQKLLALSGRRCSLFDWTRVHRSWTHGQFRLTLPHHLACAQQENAIACNRSQQYEVAEPTRRHVTCFVQLKHTLFSANHGY